MRNAISLELEPLDKFDETIARRGYQNRSEAIRDLIREHLVSEEGDQNKVIAGNLTMVYDHHATLLLLVKPGSSPPPAALFQQRLASACAAAAPRLVWD